MEKPCTTTKDVVKKILAGHEWKKMKKVIARLNVIAFQFVPSRG